jgi:hypothetical protein
MFSIWEIDGFIKAIDHIYRRTCIIMKLSSFMEIQKIIFVIKMITDNKRDQKRNSRR